MASSIEKDLERVEIPVRDENGFIPLPYLSTEEKLDEILTHMRTTAVALKAFMEAAEKSPILKAAGIKMGK